MDLKWAAREYDVPPVALELAIADGALRAIEVDGGQRVLRQDVEQFIKRTIKRGLGNRVITRLNPPRVGAQPESLLESPDGSGQEDPPAKA